MASLEFCSKHNMVTYLEKMDGNTEFHQIMDFLTRNSIYYALTVSPIVSTSFVEQFWTTAKSRTVNNISYIDAIVAGKPVTISEAIFDTIQLMEYEGDLNTLTFNKALFSPQWKFLFHTMNHCISSKSTSWDHIPTALKDVPVPLDHFPVPTLTKKVLTFMVKNSKNFSGKDTPLFDSMLVQQTEDEGEASKRPSDSQPIPSPPHPSEDQPEIQPDPSSRPSPTPYIPDSIPEGSGGYKVHFYGSQRTAGASTADIHLGLLQVTAQAKEIKALKAQVKKLKKGVKPLITHHKA
ncbi:hypothetical protein Tco_0926192 [Tanacetum coccineum]|uniref:Uncharacterized protein n=1 Tax=Tanacetum coccineum TaxID=301880 RepID=A0ABQ5DBV7_9ASTR